MNNGLSRIQRQRRIWFEITKQSNIREQNKNKNNDCSITIPKETKRPCEELNESER